MPSPPLSIVQSLSPRVAVLSSPEVIRSCEANGCRGLDELLRPWEGGAERVSILSSTLTPTIHPTFPLRFVDFASIFPNPAAAAPDPGLVVDVIGSYVGERRPDDEQHYAIARSLLLASRPITPHETFNHPVAVVFAVSTSDEDPFGVLKRLVQTHVGALQTVPWLDAANVLKFYVVVHDVSHGSDATSASELLAVVKKVYGNHSTLLTINSNPPASEPPPSPDIATHPSIPLPHPATSDEQGSTGALSQIYASALSSLSLSPLAAAAPALGLDSVSDTPAGPSQPPRRKLYASRLSAGDTQRLAALVRELVGQSLVPWMEARVREWNEVWHANRRGLTGRLFGAGRKLFGSRPSSPAPGAQAGYNSVKGYYPSTAVEALSRRLADYAFMLRDYRYASTVYDSLRRDYAQDRAARYAAGATELYGLTLLLSHNYFLPFTPPRQVPNAFTTLQHTDISSWLEQAVAAYHVGSIAGAVPLQLDALRATILYYEAWKAIGESRGVGATLVRAAGDAEEVVGAVMLEEAAAADMRAAKGDVGRRRRAFNLVLAGRRYETAGLKAHSRRCLDRAAQIYRSAPWSAAQDRIEYSLARQAYASGELGGAVLHFLKLLGRDETGVPGSQSGPLQDMELAYEQLRSHPEQLESCREQLVLPTPVIDVTKTRVLVSSDIIAEGSRATFARLEQQALESWDRKGKKPMRLLPDSSRNVVSLQVHVELVAQNPLNTPLVLSGLTVTLEPPVDGAEIQVCDDVTLGSYESRAVLVAIALPPSADPSSSSSSAHAATVTVDSVTYDFHRFLPVSQPLAKRGKRLHATKQHRLEPAYAADTSLTVHLAPPRPRVRAEWVGTVNGETGAGTGRWVWDGEERPVRLRLKNEGPVRVENVAAVFASRGVRLQAPVAILNRIRSHSALPLPVAGLDPGEEVDVDLLLSAHAANAAASGDLDLAALVLVQQAGEEVYGAACVGGAVRVRAALQVRARVQPAKAGFGVFVEVANASPASVRLDDIRSISPYWRAQAVPSDEDERPLLLPNQVYRRRLFVSAPESKPAGMDFTQAQVVEQLSLLVLGAQVPEGGHPIPEQPDVSLDLPAEADADAAFGMTASYISSRLTHRLAFLRAAFPTLDTGGLERIFPLFDPLDLDVGVAYTVLAPTLAAGETRSGFAFAHALRPAPAASLVQDLAARVARDIALGGKAVRTMYEETGRLRRALVQSVLEGVMGREEDPLVVRVRVRGGGGGGEGEKEGVGGVVFELRNLAPGTHVRVVLRLDTGPEPGAAAPDVRVGEVRGEASGEDEHDRDGDARGTGAYLGQMEYRVQLAPNETREVPVRVWLGAGAGAGVGQGQGRAARLPGWRAEVETGDVLGGDQEEAGWRVRGVWSRAGRGVDLDLGP